MRKNNLLPILGSLLLTACAAQSRRVTSFPSVQAPELSGGAWLTNSAGSSEVLRGLDLYLCPPDVDIKRLAKTGPGSDMAFSFLQSDLRRMSNEAARTCTNATTDIDGKFQIQASPGNYLLYAFLQQPNTLAWWQEPVKLTSPQSINLSSENAQDILTP